MSRSVIAAVACAAILAVGSSGRAQERDRGDAKPRPGKPSGRPVEERCKIILPPTFSPEEKLTPIVYALHGRGGDMADMANAWREPCARLGAILIVCQGGKLLGPGEYAWAGIEDAGKVIDAARAKLRKTRKPSRFAPRVLTGIGQGAWAAYSLAEQYPKTYRRLIPVAGMFRTQTRELLKPFPTELKQAMKRWHVYVMIGVRDNGELTTHSRWFAGGLDDLGAAVKAPFTDRADPSWHLYQDLGHAFPGEGAERTAELTRALKFVLQPDEQDRKHWSKVDPDWPKKAKWLLRKSDKNKQDRS